MIRRHALLLFLTICWLNVGAAEETDILRQFDERIESAAAFEYGDDPVALQALETSIFQLPKDSALRKQVEQRLLNALDGEGSKVFKQFVCDQLRVIGTPRAVPQLAKCLNDLELSHMARRALSAMEFAAANEALLAALPNAQGSIKVGLIHSLGDRRDPASLDAIAVTMVDENPAVVAAATYALGRLGGEEGVERLRIAREQASDDQRLAIDRAMLDAASHWPADAVERLQAVYQPLSDGSSKLLAVALLKSRLSSGDGGIEELTSAIRDGETRDVAIALVRDVRPRESEVTKKLAALVSRLPTKTQPLLLNALAERGDAAAAADVINLLSDTDDEVRTAAAAALGRIHDEEAILPLLRLAEGDGPVAKVARNSLRTMQGNQVNERLQQTLVDDDVLAAAAAAALASRRVEGAFSLLVEKAESASPELRETCISAIGALAPDDGLVRVIELVDSGSGSEVRHAVRRILRRSQDRADREQAVLATFEKASPVNQVKLMPLLNFIGTSDALQHVRAGLGRPVTRAVAVQSLATWPEFEAKDDLIRLVDGGESEAERQQALSGLERMIMEDSAAPEVFESIHARLSAKVNRKPLIAALGKGSAKTLAAVNVAMSFYDQPAMQATAGLAALRIANRLRQTDQDAARTVLNQIVASVKNDDVRSRAQEVLNEIDRYDDHILDWVAVGPYTLNGTRQDGALVYRERFEPEVDGSTLSWMPVTKGIGDWQINLESTYGSLNFVAAYVRTRIWSPTNQSAQVEMGADDAIRAWFNDEMIWDQWARGPAGPRQHRIPIELKQGWNDLVLKVVDHGGAWWFCCRIRRPNGTALDGLKIDTQGGS